MEGHARHRGHFLFCGEKVRVSFSRFSKWGRGPQRDLRKITGGQGVRRETIQGRGNPSVKNWTFPKKKKKKRTRGDLPSLGTSCDSDNCLAALSLSFPICTRKRSEIASHPPLSHMGLLPCGILRVCRSGLSFWGFDGGQNLGGGEERACLSAPHAQHPQEAGGLRRRGGRREG